MRITGSGPYFTTRRIRIDARKTRSISGQFSVMCNTTWHAVRFTCRSQRFAELGPREKTGDIGHRDAALDQHVRQALHELPVVRQQPEQLAANSRVIHPHRCRDADLSNVTRRDHRKSGIVSVLAHAALEKIRD
jgi:hypothetical protein